LSNELIIIEQAKSDPNALAELYRKYVCRVYHFIVYRVGTIQDAEDLTSLVWEKVVDKLTTFHPNNNYSFSAWIFQIARNCIIDYFRLHGKQHTISLDEISELVETRNTPYEQVVEQQTMRQVCSILKKLPEKQATTISLRYYAELRNKDIAIIMHVSEKTVASNLSRALLNFQKLWNQEINHLESPS